jgi:hypothetical protein
MLKIHKTNNKKIYKIFHIMIDVVHYYSFTDAMLSLLSTMDEFHPSTSNFIYKLDKKY